MLLAAAGQAAPYTYDSSATRKINNNINNNSSNSKNNVSANTSTPTTSIGAAVAGAATSSTSSTSSIASNAASALMKTLSVRLHRGTEFIKDTVQKALVMSAAPTPVIAPPQQPKPPDSTHKLKRKIYGTGGVMGTAAETSLASRQFVRSQPYIKPTPAFLRHFAVAPGALHRSASARKRNPSTDSLLMDLCMFKPIRPMPITPIKINKARGFELKRPKFLPPTSNLYSDDDDDEDDDDDDDDDEEEEHARKEPEVALKPKLSTLTLPQTETASAFVPHVAGSGKGEHISSTQQTKDNSNTHTSGSVEVAAADTDVGAADTDLGSISVKPKKVATKRRRRAPLLSAKRRSKPKAPAVAAKAKETVPKPDPAASKRKRRTAAAATAVKTASTSISSMRPSPPMTRQRARLQISTSK